MVRNSQQFDRAAEFWDRHAQRAYLVDGKSLAALETVIDNYQRANGNLLRSSKSRIKVLQLIEFTTHS
jgi:hypothetical protein